MTLLNHYNKNICTFLHMPYFLHALAVTQYGTSQGGKFFIRETLSHITGVLKCSYNDWSQ